MTGLLTAIWVISNALLFLTLLSALLVLGFWAFFGAPRNTSAGRLTYTAILAVLAYAANNFIAIYVDNRVPWWQMPEDREPWAVGIRLITYSFIFVAFTLFARFIIIRTLLPKKIPDEQKAPTWFTEQLQRKADRRHASRLDNRRNRGLEDPQRKE